MKICQITGNYPPRVCGVGSYTYHLSEHLASAGVDVSVITSSYNQTKASMTPVHVYPIMPDWQLANRNTLMNTLDQIQPDLVHLQYQTATTNEGLLIYRMLLDRHIKVITTFHDYAGPKHLGRVGKALSMWLLVGSRRFVVTHDKPRKTFEKIGVLRRKMWQIPVGSNILRNTESHTATNHNGGHEPILSYFGFVWRGKNIEQLIKMQYELLTSGSPTQLVIIGEITDQNYHQELQKIAADFGLTDRIHFTGVLDDAEISAFLRESTIAVLPYSNGATTGHGTLIAAIEHEVPVVTTFDPSIELSYFVDHKNMMLVPIGQPDKFTAAVHEILQIKSLLDTIKQNTGQLADQFSWDTIAKQHIKHYQEVLRK